MTRSSFKQSHIKRAIQAMRSAGLDVGSVRIQPDGSIEITPKGGEPSPADDLEKWMAVNER